MKSRAGFVLMNAGAVALILMLGFLIYAYKEHKLWFSELEEQSGQASTTIPACSASNKVMTLSEFRSAFNSGKIQTSLSASGSSGVAVINNQTDCTAPLVLNSYKMYNDNIAEQTVFAESSATMLPSTATSLTVALPACKAQVDLFYYEAGGILTEASFPEHLIAWSYGQNSEVFCEVDNSKPFLQIQKTGPVSVDLEADLSYSVTVSNTGNGPANDILVKDVYPNNLIFVSSAQAYCQSPTPGVVECPVGDVPAGGNRNLEFTFKLVSLPSCGESILNQVELTSSNHEALSSYASTAVNSNSCPTPTPTPTPDPVPTEEEVVLECNPVNSTVQVGTDVNFTVRIIKGTQNRLLIWSAPGAVKTADSGQGLTSFTTSFGQAGNYRVSVSSQTPGNDISYCEVNAVLPELDVKVEKTVDRSIIELGNNSNFTVKVTNLANVTAKQVVVKDVLPAGLSYVFHNTDKGGYSPTNGLWTVGDLAGGASASLTITTKGVVVGTQTNTADLFSLSGEDGNPQNNSASATVTVVAPEVPVVSCAPGIQNVLVGSKAVFVASGGDSNFSWQAVGGNPALGSGYIFETIYSAPGEREVKVTSNNTTDICKVNVQTPPAQLVDLAVEKSVSRSVINSGETTAFTVKIKNVSGTNASSVRVKDVLPGGLSYVSHSASSGTYNPVTGEWVISNISAGVNQTLTLVVSGVQSGLFTNRAELVSSTPADTNLNNNYASASVVVKTLVVNDPAVYCVIDKEQLQVGQTATAIAVGGSGVYEWSAPTVSPGSAVGQNFTFTLTSSGLHTLTITSGSNKSTCQIFAQANVVQAKSADLSLTKTVEQKNVSVGSEVTFVITVKNAGPDEATGVSVKDTIPYGLSLLRAVSSSGVFNSTAGIWEVGSLTAGTEAVLVISLKAEKVGKYINTAEIFTANEYDPDSVPGNNQIFEDDQATADVLVSDVLAKSGIPLVGGTLLPSFLGLLAIWLFRKKQDRFAQISVPQGRVPIDF